MLTCLIVGDERLAREKLRTQLAAEPDVEVVAEGRNGDEAVALLQKHHPDVVFLDIAMPGRSGLDVVAEVGGAAVVFVTAYDAYAVRAFELEALDYLLKPFDRARLRKTLARVRANVRPLTRLVVRDGDRVRFVPIESIEWIEAADNYVLVHAQGAEHLLRETLTRLAERLDPERFVRLHGRLIVAREAIAELGTDEVVLKCGTKLPVGRKYRPR
jgi:two-component system LytT family response regulator